MNKRNVYFQLRNREIRNDSSKRRDYGALRTLICHSKRPFVKVWTKHSNRMFHVECGRVFSDNYRTCYHGYSTKGGLKEMYHLQNSSHERTKIEEAIIYSCFHENFPSYDNRPCLIGLQTSDLGERLIVYDLQTGERLREIFLSRMFKFKHISWVEVNEMFYVKSKHLSERPQLQLEAEGISRSISIVMALFSAFPLKYQGMLQVDRRVFGPGITNAILSHSLLIVMYITGHVRFYSLPYILNKYKTHDHDIDSGTPQEQLEHRFNNLPLNIAITHPVPALFEVRCAEHDIQVGGFPWHYIITPHGCLGMFDVHSMEDHRKAKHGSLHMQCLTPEPDRCYFHGDGSGRIIHITAPEVRVLKLTRENNGHKAELRTVAVMNLKPEEQEEKGAASQMTSSGRRVKSRPMYDEIDTTHDMTIHQMDYEDDLDLTWVSATYQHPAARDVFRLYDNTNFQLLRDVKLPGETVEAYEHTLHVDLDTIVEVVKPRLGRFTCTVYRLGGDTPGVPRDTTLTSDLSTSGSSRSGNRRSARTRNR